MISLQVLAHFSTTSFTDCTRVVNTTLLHRPRRYSADFFSVTHEL